MSFGFYDEGACVLPHAPIPLVVQLIAEEAICLAWQRLWERSPKRDLSQASEDEVTHDLFEVLYDEVFAQGLIDGFDLEHFTVVTREKKVRNFDGAMLDKMPDLHISVASREHVFMLSQDGLFIECKPVDSKHSVGVHYGAKGIARFVRGEYAWAMTSALMIGYAAPGYSLDPKLIDMLANRAKEFEVIDSPSPCPKSSRSAVYVSRHGRLFEYVETNSAAPPILLRHLWLNCM